MNLARWRDGFFYKEEKRKREKDFNMHSILKKHKENKVLMVKKV